MRVEPDIATVARAIGEPARAAMLLQLMDGETHTARRLAEVAGIAPSTASAHLRVLCASGLVHATDAGRRRLHRLAGPEVAQLVEALAALAPPRLPGSLQPSPPTDALLTARICYGHLAGRLGVDIAARLRRDDVVPALEPGGTAAVPDLHHPLLAELGIRDLDPARPAVRACVDWSHGAVHLAGALGAALLTGLLAAGWVRRRPAGRALRITTTGRKCLAELGF
ncbi:ArsR/SmtB family transcription factor [Amycolatopsis samaneae]|uniref:ArsR/SmtB family transcription factor n=1 Tax=Amycolatopsis samaneae TaxID=664691 RepID=A0ABW5GVH6_9PSEU